MGNILDKTDKSEVILFNDEKKTLKKRNQYSWSTPDIKGTFMLIDKKELNIDGFYQREGVSKIKIAEIVRAWDWKLFGCISVGMRPDGSLWIYDGGQRTRASFYRDDIGVLPCMVFEIADVIKESKAFLGKNKMKTMVNAFDTFSASLAIKDPITLNAKYIVEKYGYTISRDSGTYKFCAIASFLRIIKQDNEIADETFGFLADIAIEGESIMLDVLVGLFMVAKKLGKDKILNKQNKDKIKLGGLIGLHQAIQRQKAIIGKGGELTYCLGILEVLNRRRGRKLRLNLQ